MSEKKYEVYDGSTKLASDMDLDVVFCLIKGYVDVYFNQPLNMTIKEICNPMTPVNNLTTAQQICDI